MPHDAVLVEVVEDSEAGLVGAGLCELTVVGLGTAAASSAGPVTVPAESGVGGGDASGRTGPEPSVDDWGLEISSVATVEVALASRGPDVLNITFLDGLGDEFGLVLGFQTHKILAMFSADVPGIQPISLVFPGGSMSPREEVVMSVSESSGVLDPVLASLRIRPDELPLRHRYGRQHC